MRLQGLLELLPLLVLELLPLVFRRKRGRVGGDLRSSVGVVRGLLQAKLSLLLLMGPSRRCLSVLLLVVGQWGQSGQESRPELLLVFTGP